MKKRIIALLLTIAAIMSVGTMSAFTSYAADSGNTKTDTVAIRKSNANTKLCSLAKKYPDTTYSQIKIHSSGSEVSKMDVWVTTSSGADMSNKYRVYPDDNINTIYYYSSQTFSTGSSVVFWGEQPNVLSQKNAKFTAYSY